MLAIALVSILSILRRAPKTELLSRLIHHPKRGLQEAAETEYVHAHDVGDLARGAVATDQLQLFVGRRRAAGTRTCRR